MKQYLSRHKYHLTVGLNDQQKHKDNTNYSQIKFQYYFKMIDKRSRSKVYVFTM